MNNNQKRFIKYAWFLVAYNVFVILWGALVRATGSGAGCGNSWPTCNGDIVHLPQTMETFIELFHRLTSALDGLLIIILVIWAFRAFDATQKVVRGWSIAALVFVITEGLLGASLVIFGWVVDDSSAERALVVALHLTNTFLLLATLTGTAWTAAMGGKVSPRRHKQANRLLVVALISTILFSAMGAITALGDTLFPATSIAAGIRADLDPASNFLIQLRVIHPLLAVGTAVYIWWMLDYIRGLKLGARVARMAKVLLTVMFVQIVAGFITVFTLAPTAMQIVHLFLADTFWLTMLIFSYEVFFVPDVSGSVLFMGALPPEAIE